MSCSCLKQGQAAAGGRGGGETPLYLCLKVRNIKDGDGHEKCMPLMWELAYISHPMPPGQCFEDTPCVFRCFSVVSLLSAWVHLDDLILPAPCNIPVRWSWGWMLCAVSDVFGMWPPQQHLSVPKFSGTFSAGGSSALLSSGESTKPKGFLLLAQGLDKHGEGTLNSSSINFYV